MADEIRSTLSQLNHQPAVATAQAVEEERVHKMEPGLAQQWLTVLGGRDNVLHVECVALTRLRIKLANEDLLSEDLLDALGSQGISQHADGVWHVVVGKQAQVLSEILGQMIRPTSQS